MTKIDTEHKKLFDIAEEAFTEVEPEQSTAKIKEVLTGGSASSAVNIPSLKPSILEPVKDYMQLAENIEK